VLLIRTGYHYFFETILRLNCLCLKETCYAIFSGHFQKFPKIRGNIPNFMFITGVQDTGNKLFTSKNGTGKNMLPISTTRKLNIILPTSPSEHEVKKDYVSLNCNSTESQQIMKKLPVLKFFSFFL
jgi:hypothetical protein